MRKLSYAIKRNDVQFETFTSYIQATERLARIKKLTSKPWEFTLDTILTEFDPDDTPERREKTRKQREKFWAKRAEKLATVGV